MECITLKGFENNIVFIRPIAYKNLYCPIFSTKVKLPNSKIEVPIGAVSYLVFKGPKKDPTFTCPEESSGVSCAFFLKGMSWEWYAKRAGIKLKFYNRPDIWFKKTKCHNKVQCNSCNNGYKQIFDVGMLKSSKRLEYFYKNLLCFDKNLQPLSELLQEQHTETTCAEDKDRRESSLQVYEKITAQYFRDLKINKPIGTLRGVAGAGCCPNIDKPSEFFANIYKHGIIDNKEIKMCGFMFHALPQMDGCYGKVSKQNFKIKCAGRPSTRSHMNISYHSY